MKGLKELTWEYEGTPYTEMFKLVADENSPFITYISEKDWTKILRP